MVNELSDFDKVYKIFIRMAKGIEPDSLPQSIQAQVDLIEYGVMIYNRKREGNEIDIDSDFETLTCDGEQLTDNEFLLLAHCMMLQIYMDMLNELTSMLSMSTKDSAIKDYKGQVSVRRQQVKDQEFLINNLVLSMFDDFENGVV